jgi:hypothetical protein
MATGTPRRTVTRTGTPAAAGNRRVRTLQGHTVGATPRPPTMVTRLVEPAEVQQHSADSLAEVAAAGNRGPQAHAVGVVPVAAEAGVVAAPAVEAGAAEVSVVGDEDKTGNGC